MFSKEELNNLLILIEVGAKTVSADKSLSESAAIQSTALTLMGKLRSLNDQVTAPASVEEEKNTLKE